MQHFWREFAASYAFNTWAVFARKTTSIINSLGISTLQIIFHNSLVSVIPNWILSPVYIEHLWFQEVSAALPSSSWRNIHFGNTFFMNPRTVNPLANDTLCWNHVRKEIHRAHRDPLCAAFMFRRVPVTNFPRDRTTVPAENTTQRAVNAIGSHSENSNAHSSARRAAITATASIQN